LHSRKKIYAIQTLLFVKTIGPEVYKRKILIVLVSKVTIAVEAWAFCSWTRHARLFIPTNLATSLNMRKRSDEVTISKKEGIYTCRSSHHFCDCPLVRSFCNQRGRGDVTCLDGSSDTLNELANGDVRMESGPIARDRVGKALGWHSVAP